MQKLQPLEDRLLIKPIKEEAKSESSVIDTAFIQKPTYKALVHSVGGGRYATETGTFMPTVLAKGDMVLMATGGNGIEVDEADEKGLLLIRESDVLALISKAEKPSK